MRGGNTLSSATDPSHPCSVNKSQLLLHTLFEMCIKMLISELQNIAANAGVPGQTSIKNGYARGLFVGPPVNFLSDIHVTVIFVRDISIYLKANLYLCQRSSEHSFSLPAYLAATLELPCNDRLCSPGYRSRGAGSIHVATRFSGK
jgi:hypothetical protein